MKSLNRTAIGQIIAGRTMFKEQCGVKTVIGVVCVKGGSALEWVCKQHGIKVVKM